MNVHAKRWLPALAAGLLLLSASPSFALVNIELRPASQTVTNGTTVGIEIYVVSDDTTNQAVGLIQVAFVWDHTKLNLTGRLNNGPYLDWFPTGLEFFGDGEAAYFAVSLPPPNTAFATPAGLLITTLQFTAIDTVSSTAISIVAQVGSRATEVRDAPTGGATVTGTFASTVTVTIECSLDIQCDDGNDCTVDSCDVPTATCGHTFEAEFTACGDPTATTCNLADSCDAAGTCLANFRSESFPCGSATNTDCDNPDTCDGAGTCLTNLEPNGFACGDQSDTVCDDANTCDGAGTCLDNFEPDTTTCGDPGDTECDNPDMCDGAGTCSTNLEPSGTACGDGTDNFCTDPDTCNGSGTCLANDFNCPGQVCIEGAMGPECVDCVFGDNSRCNDFNACTFDFCLFGNTCVNDGPAMDGTPCPDGDFCNGVETCQGGACVSPGTPCDDENLCTDDFCDEQFNDCTFIPNDNNDPDDGLFCNGTDTCEGGQVVIGTPPTCDDQNVCTLDSCDTDLDACINPNNPQGCDDGDACTFDDVCVGGQCQGESSPGGNGRVNLVWDPLTTTVRVGEPILVGLQAVSADATNDGVFSMRVVLQWDPTVVSLVGAVPTGVMTCGGVTGGTPCTQGTDCTGNPDGTSCLTQWLSEWFPAESPLNDTWTDGDAEWNALAQFGSPANVQVPPSPGLLVTSFQFVPIALGSGSSVCVVPCIDGRTSSVGGGTAGALIGNLGCSTVNVVECLSSADCDDGLACTGVESCQSNACVTPPDPCDDSQICTDDSCVEGGGIPNCTNTPNDLTDPDDGLFCNGVDTCQGGVIVPGNPPNCDDLDVCTDDGCSEDIRDCEHLSNTAACNDGLPCTNSDVCAAGICGGTPIPDCVPCDILPCDDGIGCTVDTCLATDICVFAVDDGLCPDDTVVCNGVESCDPQVGDPITGCTHSGEPCPGCVEEIGCACETPLMTAVGSRYLALTPIPAGGAVPVGIVLSACGGTMTKYVGAIAGETTAVPFDIDPSPCCLGIDGTLATLVDDPLDALFLAPGSTDGTAGGTVGWGGTVYIMAESIEPGTQYEARLDCGAPPADPVLSAAVFATTWAYGDTDGDNEPGFLDILDQVFGFKDQWVEKEVVMLALDIHPCSPDQDSDFLDMLWGVQAFKSRPYSDNNCLGPCGP